MILSWASDMISNGSELLLLVPSLRGIVGSVVLPVLGAVPDGAIVLFSGLGTNAKEQISVGVGALAGSTVMLITLPWFLAMYVGRVPIVNGKCQYSKRKMAAAELANAKAGAAHKGIVPASWFNTGVKTDAETRLSGKIMVGTVLIYLVIQIKSFTEFFGKEHESDTNTPAKEEQIAKDERIWFIISFSLALLGFFGYLFYQIKSNNANTNAKVEHLQAEAIKAGTLTLAGAFFHELQEMSTGSSSGDRDMVPLIAKDKSKIDRFLKSKFDQYDADHSSSIDKSELHVLFNDLGEPSQNFNEFYAVMDADNDGEITFSEFSVHMIKYIMGQVEKGSSPTRQRRTTTGGTAINQSYEDNDDDEVRGTHTLSRLPLSVLFLCVYNVNALVSVICSRPVSIYICVRG